MKNLAKAVTAMVLTYIEYHVNRVLLRMLMWSVKASYAIQRRLGVRCQGVLDEWRERVLGLSL